MITAALKGDLIALFKQGDYDGMAHGCNCFCRMGSGIAVDVKNAYPEAYRKDMATTQGAREKLGQFTHANYPEGIVINAYTQYTYWNPGDMLYYSAVAKVMRRINDHLKSLKKNTLDDHKAKLIIPCIGAGLARGDWNTIVHHINENTPDLEVTVVVWDKEKDPVLLHWLEDFNK